MIDVLSDVSALLPLFGVYIDSLFDSILAVVQPPWM